MLVIPIPNIEPTPNIESISHVELTNQALQDDANEEIAESSNQVQSTANEGELVSCNFSYTSIRFLAYLTFIYT